MADKATIKIPRNLYNKLNKIIEETGFNSVTEFIVYIIRDIVSTAEMDSEDLEPEAQALTGEEVEMIKKRLRSLGYLD
ncbi:MAG: ribbon-helix-helix domain-containing protein [Halanaerobiaceae bacterium]